MASKEKKFVCKEHDQKKWWCIRNEDGYEFHCKRKPETVGLKRDDDFDYFKNSKLYIPHGDGTWTDVDALGNTVTKSKTV